MRIYPMAVLPISANEKLTDTQLVDEFVMLQLRQGKMNLRTLHDKFGINLDSDFISDLKNAGYADVRGIEILLTKKGFTVCDEIAEEILARYSDLIQTPLSD